MLHAEGLKGLLLFLVAAGIVVPLFHRARVGTVLGFLIVGMLLGPYGAGRLGEEWPFVRYFTFDDPARAEPLAELGIVFLLFLLGLELSMQRLWQLRRYVLGVGLVQVAVSTFAIGLIVRAAGGVPPSGLVLGMCLALSSTAIVMQILGEQHRASSQVGRIALSVLLFQDLMVVPILFIVGVLSGGGEGAMLALATAFGQAIAAVAVIMVTGRFLARPLLRSAARTESRELIMAITLMIVLGISALTGAAGLSLGLGAFLAGLLLSESEYRHQIEVDIEPFKGLLLGIFFVTVGMSINPAVVWANVAAIAAAVIGLIAIKAAILYGAARAFRVARGAAAEVAILLAQGGEFAFVVLGLARGNDLISPELATSGVAVAGLSMMATPFLAMLARQVGRRLEPLDHGLPTFDRPVDIEDHVIIGGFGRVGQTIAAILEKDRIPFLALDTHARLVAEQRDTKRLIFFGDASRREILDRAGAARARAFVITIDSPEAAERMLKTIRDINPKARVLARAKDFEHAARLAKLGAHGVIPEAIEASLQLAARLLEVLEFPKETVARRITEVRDREMAKGL